MKRPIRIVSNLLIFSGRNLAKVGVEGSNPFDRSNFILKKQAINDDHSGSSLLTLMPRGANVSSL